MASIHRLVLLGAALMAPLALAQPGGGTPPPTPRAAAPFDLQGYWIAVVNEDWMFRMVTPPVGEYTGVPLNRAGRELADTCNRNADALLSEKCRAYGAPALMRVPGRIRFEWIDDATLSLQTEAGEKTRTFHFAAAPQAPGASRQKHSMARWELAGGTPEQHGGLKPRGSNPLICARTVCRFPRMPGYANSGRYTRRPMAIPGW